MINCYYFYNTALLNGAVDLGLPSGRLWCSHNVGAETETDYGDYFMWGSITPNTNIPCDWEHSPFNGGARWFNRFYFQAYKSEWLDDNGNLKPQYDAAHAIMGGNWRMPTKADWIELLEGTKNEWITNYNGSGVNGRLFTSKANGNTLFFPAAGSRLNSSFYSQGGYGHVWSSSLNAVYLDLALELHFGSDGCGVGSSRRFYGLPVRGVL